MKKIGIKKSIQLIHQLKDQKNINKIKINKIDADKYLDLIDKNGYLRFMDIKKSQEEDNQCLFDTMKEIYLNKKINYPKTNTNQQMQYLVHHIFKEKKIIQLQNLMALFNHFLPFEESYELIHYLKNSKNISDKQIIDLIEKIKLKKPYKNTDYTYGSKCTPNQFMFSKLGYQIKHNYKKINGSFKPNEIQYLDLCCGDGRKTIGLSQYLKIPMKNVHGADIETWGPYKKTKKFPFDFKLIENNKLNYSDNSFDVITCFLSLHHIPKISDFLDEIHRILKPTGLFVFIEHNYFDYTDEMIIDIQHTIFAYLYDKNKNYIDNPDYTLYLNFLEWDYLLDKHKFIRVKSGTQYQSIRREKRYDELFFGIYRKTNKRTFI